MSIGDKGRHSWDKLCRYLFSHLLKSSTAWHLCAEKLQVSVSLCLAWGGPEVLSVCRESLRFLTTPSAWVPEPFSFVSWLALLRCLDYLLAQLPRDWTWTTEVYPTSVLFSWLKTKIIPVTQEGICWLLNFIGNLYSVIDYPECCDVCELNEV